MKKIKRKSRKKSKKLGQWLKKLKESSIKPFSLTSRKILKLSSKFKEFWIKESVKEKRKQIKVFIIFISSYGLITNFMLWSIWNVKFTWYSWLGFGILIYFIKDESVDWIKKVFRR